MKNKNDYLTFLFCAFCLGLLLGNIWGSISVRKTVAVGINQNIDIQKEEIKHLRKKLQNVIDNNGLAIAQ